MIKRLAALSLMAGLIPLAAADIPRSAMNLTMTLENGQPGQLLAYRGKVVAVLFILTGCSHCQAVAKSIEKVYEAEKARGFEVIGIAVDQGAKDKLAAFRKEQQVTFPLAWDAPMAMFNFMQLPIMVGPKMPQLAFVDREGVIRSQYPGESAFFNDPVREKNLRAEVEKLLGPAAGKHGPRRAAVTRSKGLKKQ